MKNQFDVVALGELLAPSCIPLVLGHWVATAFFLCLSILGRGSPHFIFEHVLKIRLTGIAQMRADFRESSCIPEIAWDQMMKVK